MAKKPETDQWVACPNNPRHGEMLWHELGGRYCQVCKSEHKPRSKVAYRFAYPRTGTSQADETVK